MEPTIDNLKKIGKLTPVKVVLKHRTRFIVEFLCDCGNSCVRNYYELCRSRIKHQPSCGCSNIKRRNWPASVGERNEKIVLIEYKGRDKNNQAFFRYRCDCGQENDTTYTNFLKTESCGCVNAVFLAGQIYKNYKVTNVIGNKVETECTVCFNKRVLSKDTLRNKRTNNCVCETNYNSDKRDNVRLQFLYRSFKKVAEKRGKDSDIDIRTFLRLISSDCSYCGAPPKISSIYKYQMYKNGIDRIDSKKGYTIDNSRPCCYICNVMKSDLSEIDFFSHIERIKRFSMRPMLTAGEAKQLVKRSNLPDVEKLKEEILDRIDSIVKLSCDRGLNKTTFDVKYVLLEEKNELTKQEAYNKVVSELNELGYKIEIDKTELTIKW